MTSHAIMLVQCKEGTGFSWALVRPWVDAPTSHRPGMMLEELGYVLYSGLGPMPSDVAWAKAIADGFITAADRDRMLRESRIRRFAREE
jgi:hypothetical protein